MVSTEYREVNTRVVLAVDCDGAVTPGLVTRTSEEDEVAEGEEISYRQDAALRQGFIDCSQYTDVRNDLRGIYLEGPVSLFGEVRKILLTYRNVRGNILSTKTLRTGKLAKELTNWLIGYPEVKVFLHTDVDRVFQLHPEANYGLLHLNHELPRALAKAHPDYVMFCDIGRADIYQLMMKAAENWKWEQGYVPVDSDKILNLSNNPYFLK